MFFLAHSLMLIKFSSPAYLAAQGLAAHGFLAAHGLAAQGLK
jgi:hypothetical protein